MKNGSSAIRNTTTSRKIFSGINYSLLILFSISIVIPIILVINNSLMTNEDIILHGYSIIPRHINFGAYKFLLVDTDTIYVGYRNTLFVTIVGTFLNLAFTSAFAYGLSKKYLPYRNIVSFFVFITMIFSGGLIPTYMLVSSLGMKDSLWALIIPTLISPWNMFLMRNFFMEIPTSLEESAVIDGANDVTIFLKIYLQLSLPAIATVGLFYAVANWNAWFNAAIYLNTHSKWPLQLILRQLLQSIDMRSLSKGAVAERMLANIPEEGVKAASIILTTIPIICVYPSIQKYFVKGLLVGSIKG